MKQNVVLCQAAEGEHVVSVAPVLGSAKWLAAESSSMGRKMWRRGWFGVIHHGIVYTYNDGHDTVEMV